jgi:hypothetical protein
MIGADILTGVARRDPVSLARRTGEPRADVPRGQKTPKPARTKNPIVLFLPFCGVSQSAPKYRLMREKSLVATRCRVSNPPASATQSVSAV